MLIAHNRPMRLLAICLFLFASCLALPFQGATASAGTYAGKINARGIPVKLSVTLVPAKNGRFTVQGTIDQAGTILNLSGTLDAKGVLHANASLGTNKNSAKKVNGSWQPGKGLRVESLAYGIYGTLPPTGRASTTKEVPLNLSGQYHELRSGDVVITVSSGGANKWPWSTTDGWKGVVTVDPKTLSASTTAVKGDRTIKETGTVNRDSSGRVTGISWSAYTWVRI